MSKEKNMNTRIIHKHDIEANWEKAINFIPLKGEIIVYSADETYSYPRVKIGDGKTNVNSLPFVMEEKKENIFNEVGDVVELEVEPGTPV